MLLRFAYLQAKLGDAFAEAVERRSDERDGGRSPLAAVARRQGGVLTGDAR